MRPARTSTLLTALLTSATLLIPPASGDPAQAVPSAATGSARHDLFRFTDLGVLGGLDSRAYAVSSTGVVAGLGDTSPQSGSHAFHAFRWTPRRPGSPSGIIEDLGALGDEERSAARGVNARGVTVGVSLPTDGGSKAFVYDRSLRQLPGLGDSAEAAAIDDWGRVAGQARADDGYGHAVLWLPRQARSTRTSYRILDLGVPEGRVSSTAVALNDHGVVVGSVGDVDYYAYAAVWTPDRPRATTGSWTEIGVLPGGDGSIARDVNRWGTIVGQSTSSEGDRGFVYHGVMRELPTLPGGTESFAFAIDDHGLIVGYADGASTAGDHAVVWWHGRVLDLNELLPASARDAGYVLQGAYDINRHGQIVGVATIGGHAHGFLLTPRRHDAWWR